MTHVGEQRCICNDFLHLMLNIKTFTCFIGLNVDLEKTFTPAEQTVSCLIVRNYFKLYVQERESTGFLYSLHTENHGLITTPTTRSDSCIENRTMDSHSPSVKTAAMAYYAHSYGETPGYMHREQTNWLAFPFRADKEPWLTTPILTAKHPETCRE